MPTFNTKENKVKSNFQRINISLASPEDISARSCGEVLKPETVNYRTYKPERDGLFCEKIFGPTKDYECYCGKYKRIRYRGIVCDRCGVEVTEKKVRRERMGHIALTVPVAHIWYFKSAPNKISALLGLPSKKLESVIYYEKYIVVNPGESGIEKMELLSEDEYLDVLARFPENSNLPDGDPAKFVAKMGAEGIYDLLKQIDVVALSKELRLKDGRVCIVFLTELSQFAIEGYEVRAFDYLVKPIKYDLFSLKLTRILAHLSQSIRKYATIKDGTLTTRVCFDDIVYIESQKHYVYFHCLDQEYRTRGRLEDIQGEFLAAGFSRINRSIIVNLAHVNGYTSTDVTVKGESLPLSRVYKTDFLRELTLYLGKKH